MWCAAFVLLVAGASAECADGACEDSALMQLQQMQGKMTQQQKQAIANKIEKAFAHIKGGGEYLQLQKGFGKHKSASAPAVIDAGFVNVTGNGNYFPGDIHQDATWERCTSLNWTHIAEIDSVSGKLSLPSVQHMLQELELDQCWCTPGEPTDVCEDDTCKAVRAAIEVSAELVASEFHPVFHNYSVTTWGQFPSWTNGSVTGLDYTKPMPVKVSIVDPKGMVGFAVCDMLRVTLTQSADQMSTGTCSYVASLAALIRHAPAKVIKIAVRLFWLGMITEELGPPCDGILEQQPGLVPFKTSGGGWIPDFYGSGSGSRCHGNSADCAAGRGRPQQNIGLTFAWTQTLISTWMKENWGYCSPDSVRSGIVYPGQSEEEAAMATRNQGGWYNSMVWECKNVLDVGPSSSCKLVINPGTCSLGDPEICFKKWAMEPAFPLQKEVFDVMMTKYRSEAFEKGILGYQAEEAFVLPKLRAELEANSQTRLLEYLDFLLELAAEFQVDFIQLNQVSGPPYPSFSEVELNKTCEAKINMLIIDATVLQVAFSNPAIIYQLKLQGLPAFGNYGLPDKSYGCNHAVYLESCDHAANSYRIWTWGTTVELTREILLGYPTTQRGYPTAPGSHVPVWNTGALCASVVADKITVN